MMDRRARRQGLVWNWPWWGMGSGIWDLDSSLGMKWVCVIQTWFMLTRPPNSSPAVVPGRDLDLLVLVGTYYHKKQSITRQDFTRGEGDAFDRTVFSG